MHGMAARRRAVSLDLSGHFDHLEHLERASHKGSVYIGAGKSPAAKSLYCKAIHGQYLFIIYNGTDLDGRVSSGGLIVLAALDLPSIWYSLGTFKKRR